MLMTRATGAIGLNIQWANRVILCDPWWKAEWERQSIKRAWRTGQTREVVAVKLFAKNCETENCKAKSRDNKDKFNQLVMKAIERGDDKKVAVWDKLG
jgi:SNF2 family DNA or RNA helicase